MLVHYSEHKNILNLSVDEHVQIAIFMAHTPKSFEWMDWDAGTLFTYIKHYQKLFYKSLHSDKARLKTIYSDHFYKGFKKVVDRLSAFNTLQKLSRNKRHIIHGAHKGVLIKFILDLHKIGHCFPSLFALQISETNVIQILEVSKALFKKDPDLLLEILNYLDVCKIQIRDLLDPKNSCEIVEHNLLWKDYLKFKTSNTVAGNIFELSLTKCRDPLFSEDEYRESLRQTLAAKDFLDPSSATYNKPIDKDASFRVALNIQSENQFNHSRRTDPNYEFYSAGKPVFFMPEKLRQYINKRTLNYQNILGYPGEDFFSLVNDPIIYRGFFARNFACLFSKYYDESKSLNAKAKAAKNMSEKLIYKDMLTEEETKEIGSDKAVQKGELKKVFDSVKYKAGNI